MRLIAFGLLVSATLASGCLGRSDADERRTAAATQGQAAAAVATQVAAPATLHGLSQFSAMDQSGATVGPYRNTGGANWVGPDLINGGEIRWTEEVRRDDQVIISASGPWDVYEVSIQLGGRVYVAFRGNDGVFVDMPDFVATDLVFR